MTFQIQDIINEDIDAKYLDQFIRTADTGNTHLINATRVASTIYLALTLKDVGKTMQKELQNTGDKLQTALMDHASALNKSAEASNKHASGLKWATWTLVIVTVGLILATVLPNVN